MTPQPEPDQDYLAPLERYLQSEESPENCMQLSDLDGFLTGIVVGPELILPSEWMPVLWGGDEAIFVDREQATEVNDAIMRRYNEIISTLSGGKWTIAPIYWESGEVTIAADWAEGFTDAVRLRIDAWEPLFKHRKYADLLLPIISLCCDENGDPLLPPELEASDAFTEIIPKIIPDAVAEIHDFWRERALTPTPNRRNATANRNDSCPCGSGKKFKRCCGAA